MFDLPGVEPGLSARNGLTVEDATAILVALGLPATLGEEFPCILPGYEGALSDLKVGQRVLVKLAPTKNEGNLKGIAPGSVYKRLVELIVVEEEAQPGK